MRVNSKKIFKLIQLFSFQYGDTPLHTGARYGHAGVIRILVSADCNPSEQNKVINFSWREKVMTWNYFLLWCRIESVLKKFCQKIKEVMHLWNIHFQIHLVKLVKSDFFEHMYQFRLWAQSHKRNRKARYRCPSSLGGKFGKQPRSSLPIPMGSLPEVFGFVAQTLSQKRNWPKSSGLEDVL